MQTRCEGLLTGAVGYASLPDGGRLLLPGLLPGETAEFPSVIPRGRRFEAVDIHRTSSSPLRTEPACPYRGLCGGCDFDYVSVADSAGLKSGIVASNVSAALSRDISSVVREPVWDSAEGYRIRCRIHVSLRDRRIGFLSRRSNRLVELERCPLLSERLNGVLSQPRRLFTGAQSQLFSRRPNPKTGFVELNLLESDDGVLVEDQEGVRTVGGCAYHVSANVFFQSNARLMARLLEIVRDSASGERIMDLYSGVGTFSRLFEGSGRTVWAVERDRHCLSLARKNAPGARYFTDDVSRWAVKVRQPVDTVIVDPPRTGLGDAAGTIASWRAARVIYVSCNSASLASDLRRFQDAYELTMLQVLDFYPGSGHEESVAVLDLK